ncbi:hypothetical protein SGLAM104S_03179 [Streptomyces glaucescens]
MPHSELMPIGAFARRSGLTSSALRFYADCGLLSPAEVDPDSGYRYYSAGQLPRATGLRRLREIAMPLATVEAVLGAGPDDVSRLIDEHVGKVLGEAEAVRRQAALIKSSLAAVPGLPVTALKGPVLADAIEQVLTATARDGGTPVLGGLRWEVAPEAVTLTATDRYRLSSPDPGAGEEPAAMTWAATVDGDDLRAAVGEIRRSARVGVEATPHGIWLRLASRADQHCRLLAEEFPDHRLMLASLPEVVTRVTVAKDALLGALEAHPGERVALSVTEQGMSVGTHPASLLPASVMGPGSPGLFRADHALPGRQHGHRP